MEGNVQAVGFRVLIKQTAKIIGLKGKVRNLDDGRVEVFCEGEKYSIFELQKRINIRSNEPENILKVNVEKIHRYFENETGYTELEGGFGIFEIDYGAEATTPYEKANLEKLEIGSLMMLDLGKNMNALGSGVEKGFSTTHSDFEKLDDKYDVVSTELKSINNKISNMGGSISKLVEHLGTIIERFVDDRTKNEK